uniref:Uncharacterized protein n=1 Tax=Nelumbo nucifera TaxID=4432 RepID=A0A822Z008_NELNU|nr:TPA_asm: hypothetical protein HUJ06_007672 [Nelumbo nucifera]
MLMMAPKMAVSGGKVAWEKKMVVLTKNEVRDWRVILDVVASKLELKEAAILMPFKPNRVILDTGITQPSFCTLGTSKGLVMVEILPLCFFPGSINILTIKYKKP